ncbi:MAG: thioredoxin domain-containing protein [Sandaracinus sp.]|nr:thioredoxin domain-containing protein [Sandaracinus sp.]
MTGRVLLLALLFSCSTSTEVAEPVDVAASESAGGETANVPQVAAFEPAPEGVERYRVPLDGAPLKGDGTLVTVVVFSDFQCPFCSRIVPTLDRLLETYPSELRIAFRHYPLPFHRDAEPAAVAALEVQQQLGDAGFYRYHDLLFANQRALGTDELVAYAEQIGANGNAVRAAIAQGTHDASLERDQAYVQALAVRGTPASFINGRPVSGARPFEDFDAIVREELGLARERLARGASPARYYEDLLAASPAERASEQPTPNARAPRPDDTTVYRVPVDGAAARGPADALVTIVAFTDLECPFCSRALDTLHQLEQRYGADLRLVVRHFPLAFHANAQGAHEAAIEVRAQRGDEAFFRFHDLVFANRSALGPDDLAGYAAQVGADPEGVRRALADRRHRAAVEADQGVGQSLGVSGTPTFFVNGRRLVGAQPVDRFSALIDEVKPAAEALVRSGTPRARVYEATIANGATTPP